VRGGDAGAVTARREPASRAAPPKRYDQAYFDKWYRSARHAIRSPAELARKVALAVAVAEYVLERPVRTVLDVGAGEGSWLPPLRRLRPRVRYLGVDASEYAVARFGRARNLVLGRVDTLPEHAGPGPYDLVVCADVLNYLPADELAAGLAHVRALVGGAAYLELFTAGEAMEGDLRGWHRRPAAFYRELFDRVGLVTVGPHCYTAAERARVLPGHQRPRRHTRGLGPEGTP
jgi:predicted TPR repeat methyltransferase